MFVLTLILDPMFSPFRYGFRPNKSPYDEVRQAREFVREGDCWVVLLGRLARRIDDPRLP